jgi:hypothetical protein
LSASCRLVCSVDFFTELRIVVFKHRKAACFFDFCRTDIRRRF